MAFNFKIQFINCDKTMFRICIFQHMWHNFGFSDNDVNPMNCNLKYYTSRY